MDFFLRVKEGMLVFTDTEPCSHQGMTFSSQGKWVQEAVCSPVCSRPHPMLVASQSCPCTGLGVLRAVWV